MKHDPFDVIVIGGGHAGVEAAHVAHRTGARTALISLRADGIGVMSCNPAIGGLGKGHLVREIDALDGVMGHAADYAGIQFRLLNRRKGPAVQGPRAQSDRYRYRSFVQDYLKKAENLTVIEGEVVDLVMDKAVIRGVELADGTSVKGKSVVLTAGTFLRGVILIGDQRREGGRWGDKPSVRLAERIDDFDLRLGRLKTGTPPRLSSNSINWDMLEMQPGDEDPTLFSFLSKAAPARQISCGITHTNEQTHEVIRENLDRSAMYGGHVEGVGPRYCPSIEDKVVRFADKPSHQIFLEPEGLDDNTVYPNGISTSLPQDVQMDYVHSIVGLETAEILQPGYAIEYDYVDPQCLDLGLGLRNVQGLYLAGQINGTTGYEEAGAQGLVAGMNAARYAHGMEPMIFDRSQSYIGVMIDDLVTRGVNEPYRMFTSRAEYRLSLRADNADQRLTEFGRLAGCVGEDRFRCYSEKHEKLLDAKSRLTKESYTPTALRRHGFSVKEDGKRRSPWDLLAFPDVEFENLVSLDFSLIDVDASTRRQICRDAMYSTYIERQKQDIAALKRDYDQLIPQGIQYDDFPGLSNELKEKLKKSRPLSIGHASRIEGMTPAALTLLLARIKQFQRKKSA